jgi:hypothetical protein
LKEFAVKEIKEIIRSPSSLHSDTVVYYVPISEIDEKYPRLKRTRRQLEIDNQNHKGAAIHAQMLKNSGWWV